VDGTVRQYQLKKQFDFISFLNQIGSTNFYWYIIRLDILIG